MPFVNTPLARANILVLATGIVFLAVLSLQSLDIPVRRDITGAQHFAPVDKDTRGNGDSIPGPQPVPPALQKGFLR